MLLLPHAQLIDAADLSQTDKTVVLDDKTVVLDGKLGDSRAIWHHSLVIGLHYKSESCFSLPISIFHLGWNGQSILKQRAQTEIN
jgi:hypothetical protein